MARLIFISPYLKGGKDAARLAHRTRYVATREGVEKLKVNSETLPPSKKQNEFIQRMLRSYPEAREMLEYEDYKEAPSQKTASELIDQMREQYLTALDQRENFLDYVAHRPGVQREGDHGLWDANGKVPVLSRAIDEVANHEGIVWTPVVSIRREDAERLGYTNVENWRALVKSNLATIADAYKIPPSHLRWYAALHEKEKHVHIHMVVFSSDPKEGYLTKQGIRQVKSAFAKNIFRQDLINVYERKTTYRDALQKSAEEKLSELIWQMEHGTLQSPTIEKLMTELSARLPNVSGRKVYGYLPPQLKKIVDAVVDELSQDARVAEAYALWQEMHDAVCRVYSNDLPERLPLSKQKEFKAVRNMVVREALKLSSDAPTFEDDEMDDDAADDELVNHNPYEHRATAYNLKGQHHRTLKRAERYCKAKETLYNPRSSEDETWDMVAALEKLWDEGYLAAAYLLGKVYRDGAGVKQDMKLAEEWLLKSAEKGSAVAQYALGKLLLEQGRTAEAVMWLEWAATQKNQYAQYALAKLLLSEDNGYRDIGRAIEFIKAAADQGNQYAQYAYGKMLLFGENMTRNEDQAIEHLSKAAAQGNVYAQYLLDHRNDRHAASVGACVIRLLHNMGKIFQDNTAKDSTYRGMQIDKKRRKQLQEKRLAMGHKADDHEDAPQQQM